MPIRVFTIVLALLWTLPAAGRPQSIGAEEIRRELLGALLHTRVDVRLDHVPARDAFEQLAAAAGVIIIGRYEDDAAGHGLDPAAPITLRLVHVTALDALEMILDQATLFEAATWQLRNGFVEVGTKRRLCASSRQQRYGVPDLLLEPPHFVRDEGGVDVAHFRDHPYRQASLRVNWGDSLRLRPQQILEELIRAVSEAIEPANWDFVLTNEPPLGPDPVRWTARPVTWQSDDHRIAKIRQWQTRSLFVKAPDFVHRQIGGYGDPIAPALEGERPASPAPPQRPAPGVTRVAIEALPGAAPRSVWSEIAETTRRAEMQDDAAGGDAPVVIDGRLAGDAFRRRVLEVLLGARISLFCDALPAREAIDRLRQALPLPIIARHDDDRLGFGIDPDRLITLRLDDATALDALNAVLDACSEPGVTCTWQIRRGYLELGSKTRLSVPAARELRLYHIRDLMIDIPGSHRDKRRLPVGIALDRVETIVTTVEPDAWDWGQIDYYDDERDDATATPGVRVYGDPDSGGGAAPGGSNRPGPGDRGRPRYVEIDKPAIVRHWRDVLIVVAPDFIHRQIGGADGRAGLPGNDPAWAR